MNTHIVDYVKCEECGWEGVPIQTKTEVKYDKEGVRYIRVSCPDCNSSHLVYLEDDLLEE